MCISSVISVLCTGPWRISAQNAPIKQVSGSHTLVDDVLERSKHTPTLRLTTIFAASSDGLHDTFGVWVSTYDVWQSGCEHVLTIQDVPNSKTHWYLLEIMRVWTSDLIVMLGGYNQKSVHTRTNAIQNSVLGRHANPCGVLDSQTEVILPSDLPITIMLSVAASQISLHNEAHAFFLRFLT